MKEIKLTQGKVALVDDDDYERINKFKWVSIKNKELFYACRRSKIKEKNNKSHILMHREIMGNPAGLDVDHIDGNGLNNQKYNLRECSRKNNLISRKKSTNTSSKYKGVIVFNDSIIGSVCSNYRIFHKKFKTELEAALWYDEMAIKLHGEFARTNKMLGLL